MLADLPELGRNRNRWTSDAPALTAGSLDPLFFPLRLEQVIQARNAVAQARDRHDVAALGAAETGLRAGLGQLFALAENYPQLKANESFQHLQQRISGLESGIADRRELYNEAVNLNNVRIEQFPDVVLARLFAFQAAELLRFSEAEKADVDLKQLFS